MPSNDLDRILKVLWQAAPGLFAHLVVADHVGVVTALPTDTLLVERRPDAVALVQGTEGEFVLHVEFETAPSRDLPMRMVVYNVLLAAVHAPLVVRSAVVLLRRPRVEVSGRVEWRYADHDPELRFGYRVVRLYEVPASTLAADPMLAPLSPLGRGPSRRALEQAAACIRSQPMEGAPFVDRLACLYVLGGRVLGPAFRAIIDLEEVRMSWVYESILKEGYEKGIERGIDEGEVRIVRRQLILRLGSDAAGTFEPLLARCGSADLEWLADEILVESSATTLRERLEARLAAAR